MRDFIDIVLEQPPSPSSDFVDAEDQDGHSIRAGQWIYDGRFWRLRIVPASFHEDYVPDTSGILVSAIAPTAIRVSDISSSVITSARLAEVSTSMQAAGRRRAAKPPANDAWALLAVAACITLLILVAAVWGR